MKRRLPIGAEPYSDGTYFRVWAPKHESIDVVFDSGDGERTYALTPERGGWFAGHVASAGAGTRYRFRPGNGSAMPDPASRFQPDGPHGASLVVDPTAFQWSDADWNGPSDVRHVVYEIHIGTFTREGTWSSAIDHLSRLVQLGITIIEVMPVAEFPGRFNWGYDGVTPFAPAHVYGEPDDMRRFIDRAHALGLAVVLDVVYNHVGPDGCYLPHFADEYFSRTHRTDWGPSPNFDGPGSPPVREFFIANVEYWISEFHLDGLRFDATQSIHDASPRHILEEMVDRARAAANGRRLWMVSENEPQDVRAVKPAADAGFDMDAIWNDDFHHSAMVALTGVREAYYCDYLGAPQELVSCARHGFLFQGQHCTWQDKPRGSPTRGIAARRFVNFLQNHDQIANSADGRRIHELTGPAELRAMTTLLVLMPGTPMLFQGQEFASSSRFLFFADHNGDLAHSVLTGRGDSLAQFRSLSESSIGDRVPDPASLRTLELSRLDHAERNRNRQTVQLFHDLIDLIRHDAVVSRLDVDIDGAVLSPRALALRWYDAEEGDRLLVMNLGADLRLHVVPEPLLAPPADRRWTLHFTSEAVQYGGRGTVHPELHNGWLLQARSAVLLAGTRCEEAGND